MIGHVVECVALVIVILKLSVLLSIREQIYLTDFSVKWKKNFGISLSPFRHESVISPVVTLLHSLRKQRSLCFI